LLTQRLQELRKESGMTQQQVADAIQTTLRQYQRFEKGEQKPGYDNLVKLADCFQVSLDYLAGRSESKTTLP
jgi:transcriptional regulator with XRE-family HTH domain